MLGCSDFLGPMKLDTTESSFPINNLEIVYKSNHSKYYRNGMMLLGASNILVGISPANSFFSEAKIIDILSGISNFATIIYVLIPDIIHINNYRGLGYTENIARASVQK
jgi:hypothetical protein